MRKTSADKKKNTRWTLLGRVAVGLIVLYLGSLLYLVLHHTYRTETAISYTMQDSILLDGVAVFTQQPVQGTGNIGYLVADGERVSAGTQVAEIYSRADQADLRKQIERLDSKIELLDKSQKSTGTDLGILTSQSLTALYDLMDLLRTGEYENLETESAAYLLAASRKQISTGTETGFSEQIGAMQAERDGLAAQLGETTGIYAPINGYFVSAENSEDLNIDAQTLAESSPAQLRQLLDDGLKGMVTVACAGKVVTDYKWYFYASATAEQAARFADLTRVQISFPDKMESFLPATVEAVETDETTGEAKITLSCEYISAEVLQLGQETAEIALHTYEGLRIDAKARHVVDGVHGVYVLYGNMERFRKIQEIYEDEEYILVAPGGALRTENELRLYDEVIVEGNDLRDKKVL